MSSDNRPAVRQQDMKPIGQPRKPQLSVETALAGLLVPAPAQTNMDIAPKDDVFPGLFMNVSVNEIDFFDKNPRTRHDPEQYGQIKQSIREAGVQQPVHITRRPGDNRFVLAQGGNTGQSPATAAGTVRLPENSRQAASAATSTLTDAPATVAPPLDAAAKRYDGAQSAAAALAYADRDAALQALHQAVRSLLSAVGLNDCFRTHAAFPYAFYLEYPDFRNLPQTNPHAIFAIDHLHAEAGNVFVFLCRVSGQDRLMSDLSLGEANPILGLPEHSTVLSAYRDADVWDEYATMGIGERAYLLDSVLEWQTADTPYSAPVAAILAAMRAVRTFDAGGGHD